jgi:hypothetical protein
VGDRQSESSAAFVELIRQMRMAAQRSDTSENEAETWSFLCECGDDSCREWVTLPVSGYEALQRADQPILAPGHSLSASERTRRQARRLRDDAKALRAQAEQQTKRAKKNRRKPDPT